LIEHCTALKANRDLKQRDTLSVNEQAYLAFPHHPLVVIGLAFDAILR
jgi:hypothetical protein